ncbi:MAG: cyclodeaminase/cyclohydrolase family protein [Phycisphaerales bacterium]|jgi:formiminotetrahydrofolate cyclodeaminase|nr:cyclodeaminase/cyclohydrolase family protein [Phycisphaerales bacterium]
MSSFSDLSLPAYLDRLADKSPVPGGGSVAGVVGASGAALAAMVLRYSIGKKSLLEHDPALRDALARVERARALFLALADEDARAYEPLNAAFRLPEPERAAAIARAAALAILPPRHTLAAASDALRLLESLPSITNKQLHSDLAIAAVLLDSAARSSRWNIAVNLPLLSEAAARESIERESNELLASCARRCAMIESACRTT